ncbi:MAG: NUDIX domain-containing protein [Acidimicrobiia bacterium]|nr:NUDIX domain-containing protein [Acidimicrobiia bacterium]
MVGDPRRRDGRGGDQRRGRRPRGLYEETGVRDAEIGPCVWTQHSVFDFGGFHFDQDEFIHVAWTRGQAAYEPAHLEAVEAMAFEDGRWWPLDELYASDVPLLPPALRELLPAVAAGDLPDPPLDITGR